MPAGTLDIADAINRLTDPSLMSAKGKFKVEVREIIREFGGGSEFNSGLTEVQVAILTRKVAYMTHMLKDNRKDKHNIRNLQKLISRRRKLLKYLCRKSRPRYYALIETLGLRDIYGGHVLRRGKRKFPAANQRNRY